ncbi:MULTISPECIES: DeoR/GlpR family DNA-binding transcription regulator [Enterococcus]|uniref:DeoR/GlpR family DNA-binding transcription regulator n=1 Tax=Enterococcus TaxID=1350 RepID=UPI00065DC900|nr:MULTISPECIES: DeoR/GlpR family DNA-binding transcription regulator [Enterococcus]KAF1300129.1 DeoR family transcriptional regulator [Enterococcus sp. JM9B]
MLTEERQQKILSLLEEKNIVKLHELTNALGASESTIRRDLQELEDQQLLTRIHGGAKKIQRLGVEPTMLEKTQKNATEKKAIAQQAVNQLHKNEVIYLDAGSTTYEMIPLLPTHFDLKVVTNSVKHAALLIDRQIATIIIGGTIKLSTNAAMGSTSAQQLKQYRFNKTFLGMNGVEDHCGLTTPDPEEAALKRLAIENSEQTFVLIDHSKFQQITFTQVAPLDSSITLITDHVPDGYRSLYPETTIMEVKQ